MDKKDVKTLEIIFDKASKEATRTYNIINGMS